MFDENSPTDGKKEPVIKSDYDLFLQEKFPYSSTLEKRVMERRSNEADRNRFEKEASKEDRSRVDLLRKQLEALSCPDLKPSWDELSNYPCTTHVTIPDNLKDIFSHGLKPASEHEGYSSTHSGFDDQFPELGLTDVVHCGWGGLDQFSTGGMLDYNVILLMKPQAIKPNFLVTNLDWTKWGAISIYKAGGGKLAREHAISAYLSSMKKAGDFGLDPYKYKRQYANFLKFLFNGWPAEEAGVMTIPTITIPQITPDQIEGVIVGNAAAQHNKNIPGNVPTFNLDDLQEADLYGIDSFGSYHAQMSQRVRFAEAIILGREQAFLKAFTLGKGGPMDQYFEYEAEAVVLRKQLKLAIQSGIPHRNRI